MRLDCKLLSCGVTDFVVRALTVVRDLRVVKYLTTMGDLSVVRDLTAIRLDFSEILALPQ